MTASQSGLGNGMATVRSRLPLAIAVIAIVSAVIIVYVVWLASSAERSPDKAPRSVYSAFLEHWPIYRTPVSTGGTRPLPLVVMNPISIEAHSPDPAARAFEFGTAPETLYAGLSELQAELTGLRDETWRAFVTANNVRRDLRQEVAYGGQLVFLEEKDLWTVLGSDVEEGWKEFHDRFRSAIGYVVMSSAGISDDECQALLYVECYSGPHAASGSYYLLVRDGDTWRIADEHTAWLA